MSSGRLRRIAAGPGEAGGLAGRALSRDDGAAAAAVISAFAGAAGAVLVVSDPTEDEVGASGVSTTRLAAEAPASGDLPPAAEAPAAEAPESGAGGSGDPVTDPAGAFQADRQQRAHHRGLDASDLRRNETLSQDMDGAIYGGLPRGGNPTLARRGVSVRPSGGYPPDDRTVRRST